jgi:hypothetical protein
MLSSILSIEMRFEVFFLNLISLGKVGVVIQHYLDPTPKTMLNLLSLDSIN